MTTFDVDVSNAVQTELKLYMTQQLHKKGYLSDEMYSDATELILKDAKKLSTPKKEEINH
jgi:hypothetical protein